MVWVRLRLLPSNHTFHRECRPYLTAQGALERASAGAGHANKAPNIGGIHKRKHLVGRVDGGSAAFQRGIATRWRRKHAPLPGPPGPRRQETTLCARVTG